MEVLLGVFSALGVLVVLWCLALLLLSPLSGRGMIAVWRLQSPGSELEFRVRCCVLLQKCGLCPARLVLVDCGLCPENRKRAEFLAREQPFVDLVGEKDLLTYLDMVSAE